MLLERTHPNELQDNRTAERVLGLLLRHSLGEPTTNPRHLARIRRAIERNAPIELVLPAFPAKSANREKTHGDLPDYGEVLGLERLQETCDAIQRIHAPGARALICSDGRVFSDLVMVSENDVTAYGRALREMIAELGFTDLRTFSLEDVFGSRDFAALRERLVKEHGRSVEEVREEALACPTAAQMFNGIHRFLFEDRLALDRGKSRNRVREETKTVAYQVIQRSNAWSSLVESLFPDAVRLSIHPQPPASAKIGFRLVECESAWGTPWHNVALLGTNGFRLVKRREALRMGAKLAHARGKFAFYREAAL